MGDPEFARLAADVDDARLPDSPHDAVRRLLDWLEDGTAVPPPIDPSCAAAVAGVSTPAPGTLRAAFRQLLTEVMIKPGEWGFATARRPVAPDVEQVLLVKGGADALVAFTPQTALGFVFELRFGPSGWEILRAE